MPNKTNASGANMRPAWYRIEPGQQAHLFRKDGVSACDQVKADIRYAFKIPSWMVKASDRDLCRQCVEIARAGNLIEEE